MFWNKICGFGSIFFLFPFLLTAQSHKATDLSPQKIIAQKLSLVKPAFAAINNSDSGSTYLHSISLVPANYYTQHFGIMCKQELALEKFTKIPFRFRLGSLQQCNYIEGKR